MEDALRRVGSGGCEAWSLPGDPTCAGIARRAYRRVAGDLDLDPGLIDDGVMIVSELAANTLHVHGEDAVGGSELWLYLRGAGASRELVCKVFDTYPGWLNGAPSGHSHVPSDALSGRGLGVVHELSGGHWGYHLTRARVGEWHTRGKAVWFAMPVSRSRADHAETALAAEAAEPVDATVTAETRKPSAASIASIATIGFPPPEIPSARLALDETIAGIPNSSLAMAELEAGLEARGLGGTLVRADDSAADMAVLSVRAGITLWCRDGAAWLRAPGADGRRWGYGDLVELTEQTVEACETAAGDSALARLAGLSCTGA